MKMTHSFPGRAVVASVLSLMTVAALSTAASAQITPITVTGFTTDDIYNGLATDSQVGNFDFKNGYDFYSVGANTAAPTSGIPVSGTVTKNTDTFQLQSFAGNNVVQLAAGANTPFTTTGTLTLTAPARYSSIGILSGSANGSTTVNVTFNYVGGTNSTTSFTSNDWFGSNQFITAGGRVSLSGASPAYETNGTNPGLYENLLTPANTTLALQSITFTTTASGNSGQTASIFAISGTAISSSAAPEPVSVALAGMGLLGILAPVISRRRK